MIKKKVVFIIDSLGRGGAETLLVGILPELTELYDVVIVTLSDICEFEAKHVICSERYSLGYSSIYSFLKCVFKLRKLLEKIQPDFIHAHLLISTQIARVANGGRFPFIYSLHSILSVNAFSNSWMYRNLEKMLFNKQHFVIAVSNEVLKDYEISIRKCPNSFVLKNYISDDFSKSGDVAKKIPSCPGKIKIVAVGNIKRIKNYEYLIDSFMLLKERSISLDIYGAGEPAYIKLLQQKIDDNNLPVTFRGPSKAIVHLLPAYDLFVMSSISEGFGLAAIEAMALGLPLLLSDVQVLREVTCGNALFFNTKDPASFVELIREIHAGKHDLEKLTERGKQIVKTNYTKHQYMTSLVQIYEMREIRS